MNAKNTMKRKGNGFKLFLFLVTIVIILGGGYYFSFGSKSMDAWIKEKDEKVVEHLNKAADLFTTGRYSRAEDEFEKAYDLAKIADKESSILWAEHIEKIAPPRKFFTGNPATRSSKGSIYFKNRMIEAIYGYASSVNWRVTDKFAKQTQQELEEKNRLFQIPPSEFQPAIDAINRGIEIDPQSEMLRVLKAEIMTSLGQFNEAIALLEEVTTLINTGSADAFNQLGIIYSQPTFMNTSNHDVYREKAISMFEKASLLTSSSGGRLADPNFNLGLYYSTPAPNKTANALPSVIDARKAIHYFEEYLKIAGDTGASSDRAKEEIEKLQRIAP